MSSFSSLNVGSLAIHAAQRGLDVTGQNISNTATTGYSRQRVEQVAIGGPTVPAIWSRYDGAGGGVKVTGVSRMRDEFLEARARVAHSNLAETEKLEQTYAALERTFDEPSTTGLQTKLADFWNSWAKISNAPRGEAAEAARKLTFERAGAVADHFNHLSRQLEVQWDDALTEARANVTDVNVMAKDVANLNRAIRNNTIAGLPSNELADQRDLLVEKITTLTGAVAERADDGQVNVKFANNQYLVRGYDNSALKLTTLPDPNQAVSATNPTATPRASQVSIQWAQSGDPEAVSGTAEFFNPSPVTLPVTATTYLAPISKANNDGLARGEISGQLKTLNEVVPSYLNDLDAVAQSFAATVNTQQAQGYTANNTVAGVKATALYTPGPGLTAGNIALVTGATANSLAVSAGDPAGTPSVLDGDNAMAMSRHLSDAAGADASYRANIVQLGVEAQSVQRNGQAQAVVAKDADDARENVSGVSLNEEMTNLVKYQHSFSAAAKFITTVDSTIEALLNMVR